MDNEVSPELSKLEKKRYQQLSGLFNVDSDDGQSFPLPPLNQPGRQQAVTGNGSKVSLPAPNSIDLAALELLSRRPQNGQGQPNNGNDRRVKVPNTQFQHPAAPPQSAQYPPGPNTTYSSYYPGTPPAQAQAPAAGSVGAAGQNYTQVNYGQQFNYPADGQPLHPSASPVNNAPPTPTGAAVRPRRKQRLTLFSLWRSVKTSEHTGDYVGVFVLGLVVRWGVTHLFTGSLSALVASAILLLSVLLPSGLAILYFKRQGSETGAELFKSCIFALGVVLGSVLLG